MTDEERRYFERTMAEADQNSLDFIVTELMSVETFAGVARTEYAMEDLEAAAHARGEAEKAYDTADRFLLRATDKGLDTAALSTRLAELRKLLDSLPARGL